MDFSSLVEDIRGHKFDLIYDEDGKPIDAFALIEEFYRTVRKFQEEGLYPLEYDNPIGCQLELTHKCNLNCIHCYNRSGKNAKEQDIPWKKWIEIAKELADLELCEIVISGGEPLILGNKLFELMDILNDAGVVFVFISNGTLMKPEYLDKFSRYMYSWFQISIDGSTKVHHEKIRGKEGNWEKVVKCAANVDEIGIPTVIAHVVTKINVHGLEDMIDLAYYLGARKIICEKYIYSGRAIDNDAQLELTPQEYDYFCQVIVKKIEEFRDQMIVKQNPDPGFYLRLRAIEPNGVLLIRPNGDIKIDCIAPAVIGNVNDSSIAEIWQKKGKNIWQKPELQNFLHHIRTANDFRNSKFRPYHDPPIRI
ncbi:MAG: radical SAM/SPASM domain-containing protein [Candidatus Helarchaeota archaeon]